MLLCAIDFLLRPDVDLTLLPGVLDQLGKVTRMTDDGDKSHFGPDNAQREGISDSGVDLDPYPLNIA